MLKSWYRNIELDTGDTVEDDIDKSVIEYLKQIQLLQVVPIRYLIPNEIMLPEESIRYFAVDGNWVQAMIDGFTNVAQFQIQEGISKDAMTGFILRSKLIETCVGLQFQGMDASNSILELLRLEKLNSEVMIGIFRGKIQKLGISRPKEGVHMGFYRDSVSAPYVTLKDWDTGKLLDDQMLSIAITDRKINIRQLVEKLKPKDGIENCEINSCSIALTLIKNHMEGTIQFERE